MADEADQAQEHIEAAIAEGLTRTRGRARRLPAIGRCHACGAALPDPERFCDAECRQDFLDFEAADRRKRGRR